MVRSSATMYSLTPVNSCSEGPCWGALIGLLDVRFHGSCVCWYGMRIPTRVFSTWRSLLMEAPPKCCIPLAACLITHTSHQTRTTSLFAPCASDVQRSRAAPGEVRWNAGCYLCLWLSALLRWLGAGFYPFVFSQFNLNQPFLGNLCGGSGTTGRSRRNTCFSDRLGRCQAVSCSSAWGMAARPVTAWGKWPARAF